MLRVLARLFLPASFLACVLGITVPACRAQQGDRAGQAALMQKQPDFPIPPAPPLSAADALKTFKVAPGFHVELVASEPLVESPVAIAFDTQGRIWVCEMRGYMPDVNGHGEDQPVGRIVILEDTDGDGKMDKSTVFLDNLVLPRAIAFAHGGVLIAEPPKLWFCGLPGPDGRATSKTELVPDYATSRGHPEYMPNGLLWAMDNWIYSARGTERYRFDEAGKIRQETTTLRGQWGIAQDDAGRLFYNYNSDQLRGDLIPYEYLRRNPNLHDPEGTNVRLVADQTVFPARVNPGTNRGYEKSTLRPDGTLRTYTAACGPTIYRGDLFPAEFRGNAFLCEPAGNLVRRNILDENHGQLVARNAYDKSEFLASTDERFRPVNLETGPDGALYVVDMYRGIIQHKAYVTTYLRNQILARGLEQPLDQGAHLPHRAGRKTDRRAARDEGSIAAGTRQRSE